MLPRNDRQVDEYRYALGKFRQIDRVYLDIGINTDDPETLGRAADEVFARFSTNQNFERVTYQIESGKPMVVTHRVVGTELVDGETRLVTRGDANEAPDVVAVREEQVKGVVWYHVPMVGFATSLIDDVSKGIAVRILGGLLLAYAVYLGASLLFRRKKVTH